MSWPGGPDAAPLRAGAGERDAGEPDAAPLRAGAGEPEAGEVVDGLPVVAQQVGASLEPARPASVPARQAAALAATGFVAGAATAAILGRRAQAGGLRRRRRAKGSLGEVVASNSFLIDVHVLKR